MIAAQTYWKSAPAPSIAETARPDSSAPFLYIAGEDEFESKQKIIGSQSFILKKVKLIVFKLMQIYALMDQLFEWIQEQNKI